jgi:hypothetical protein
MTNARFSKRKRKSTLGMSPQQKEAACLAGLVHYLRGAALVTWTFYN